MANWDAPANKEFQALKQASNATDQQMQGLKQQIDAWAGANPNGRQSFPFAPLKMRNAAVEVKTVGGWIKSLSYGEK